MRLSQKSTWTPFLLANLLDNPNVGWVRPVGGDKYDPQGRPEDDPFIREYIRDRHAYEQLAFNAVCHSISSHEINIIIARICTTQQTNHLQTLVNALYPAATTFDVVTDVYHQLTSQMMATLQRCRRSGNAHIDDVITHFAIWQQTHPPISV